MHLRQRLLGVTIASLLLAGCAAPETPAAEADDQATLPDATDQVARDAPRLDEGGRTALTMAPGTTAHVPVILDDVDWDHTAVTVDVGEAADVDVTVPDAVHGADAGAVAGWVRLDVPADAAPGEREVTLHLRHAGPDGDEARAFLVRLLVAEPEPALAPEGVYVMNLTVRAHDGAIAFTTASAMATAPFRAAPGFQPPQEFTPMRFSLAQAGQMPPALLDALAQSAVGHSLSVAVPDTFGPESVERDEARVETVERTATEQRVFEGARAAFEAQGLVDDATEVGDALDVPGSPFTYVVDHLNETDVRVVMAAEEGEHLTLYPAWPNATVVVNVSEETVTLLTTPDAADGERFTWRNAWPDATEVVDVDDATVTIRHTPPEGLTYVEPSQQGRQVELTVVAVEDDRIVVSQPNGHPLAGETLVFEVTVLGEEESQGAGAP